MEKKRGIKKLWALIFWTRTCDKDVIPLKSIPKPSERVEGATTILKWSDQSLKQKGGRPRCTLEEARVLVINESKSYLEGLNVDALNGSVIPHPQKALTREVTLEKKQLALAKKQQEVSALQANLEMQRTIVNSTPILHLQSEPAPSNEQMKEALVSDDEDYDSSSEPEAVNTSLSPNPVLKMICAHVTADTIAFVESLLASMKEVYENQTKQSYRTPVKALDVAKFKIAGPGMVPFYEGACCFLPQALQLEMESNSVVYHPTSGALFHDWKGLVRQVLVHMYGRQLANHCAKGREGSRPGIDPTIRVQLFKYAQIFSRLGDTLTEGAYIAFLNSLTSNRRPAKRRKVEKPKKVEACPSNEKPVCEESSSEQSFNNLAADPNSAQTAQIWENFNGQQYNSYQASHTLASDVSSLTVVVKVLPGSEKTSARPPFATDRDS